MAWTESGIDFRLFQDLFLIKGLSLFLFSLTNDIKRLIDSYHDHGIEDTDIYQRTALIFDALYRSYGGKTKFAYPAQAKSQLVTLPTNTGEHSEALKNQEQALMTRIDSLKGK